MKHHSNTPGSTKLAGQGENQLLSGRELEVLWWLTSGASNQEIAHYLYITESTVKRHIYNIFGKLNVRNRTRAAVQARKMGLNPQPRPRELWEGNRVNFSFRKLVQ